MTLTYLAGLLILDTCLIFSEGQTVTLPSSSTAVEGGSFRLKCTVIGGPDPPSSLLTFKYDGKDACNVNSADCSQIISSKPRFSCGAVSCGSVQTRVYFLDINPVSRQDDRDDWKCDYNNVISTGSLTVNSKPTISGIPNPYHVTENTNLQLDCRVYTQSNPVVSYRWSGPSGYSSNGPVLSITNINRDKSGQYTCTATNSIGTGTGQTMVDVQYKPTVSGIPNPFHVTENTNLQLDCSRYTTPGKPSTTSYRWSGPGGYSSNGPVLSITNINRDKSGQYTCTATNTLTPSGGSQGAGTGSSGTRVDVQYKASIQSFTANSDSGSVIVDESTPVNLTCQVDSNPRSTIRLMNGSQELKMEGNSLTASTELRPSCRQRGNYSCTATNSIGTEAKSVVKLAVRCYPRVDEASNVQDKYGSSVGGNVTVSVPILAYPVPTFTWRRNTSTSQNLSGSFINVSDIVTNAVLQLTRIQQQDLGEYTLTEENGVGDPAVFTVTIVPQGPPETPTNLTVRPDGPHSLVVAWKQEFNGGAEQTFTVEYSKDKVTWIVAGTYVESKDNMYQQQTISDLQPSTTYYVKVISRNEFGEKKYTETVSGQTEQAIEVTPPGSPAAVIGGVVGGVAILIVMAVVVAVVILRRKKEKNHHESALCDTSEEMKENDLYVGGEDLARGSSTAVNTGDVYAMPDKKNKGKEKESKATNMGDVYAMPDKKNKGKEKESKGKKDKKKGKKGLAEDKKQGNPRRNRGDVYENAAPGQYGARANKGFEGEVHAASNNEDPRFGRNEDGLMYVGIDFGNQKPSQEIRKTEDCTEYAGIAIGKVGAPLPDDDAETTK